MNAFLVFGNCPMDDVPMCLETTRRKAEQAVASMTKGDICRMASKVLRRDVTPENILGIGIIEFRDGVPIKCTPCFIDWQNEEVVGPKLAR